MSAESNKTILYIEDNDHSRRIVRKILEKHGYEVLEAEDGITGLNSIQKNHPPLVLLDISLPRMDGVEIARRVRADDDLKHIVLIALTASSMDGDRERFLEAGCDEYMSKPFKAKELIEMVDANFPYDAVVNFRELQKPNNQDSSDSSQPDSGPTKITKDTTKELVELNPDTNTLQTPDNTPDGWEIETEINQTTDGETISADENIPDQVNDVPKDSVEEIEDPQKDIKTGQLNDPQEGIETGELSELMEKEDEGTSPKGFNKSIHFEKTTTLPNLESVMSKDEKTYPEKASDADIDELMNNSWLSKVTHTGDESEEKEKSIGEKIFDSVNNQPTGKLPEIDNAILDKTNEVPEETKKKDSSSIDEIYDAIMDEPSIISEDSDLEQPKVHTTSTKMDKIFDAIMDESGNNKNLNLEAENIEAKTTISKKKSHTINEKGKDQISTIIMDTITIEHIDPANPDVEGEK